MLIFARIVCIKFSLFFSFSSSFFPGNPSNVPSQVKSSSAESAVTHNNWSEDLVTLRFTTVVLIGLIKKFLWFPSIQDYHLGD